MFKQIGGFAYKVQLEQCLRNTDKEARIVKYA